MESARCLADSSSFSFCCSSSDSFCFNLLSVSFALRSETAALSLSASSSWRDFSSASTTCSNRLFSVLTSSFARSITSSGIPRRWDIANAFDLPGTPTISRYVGFSVFTSNSQEAFSTPSVWSANILTSW